MKFIKMHTFLQKSVNLILLYCINYNYALLNIIIQTNFSKIFIKQFIMKKESKILFRNFPKNMKYEKTY